MTIASKLQKILEIKNNIKQALINKGVDVSNNFENFAEKIESIQGGEDSSITSKTLGGLCVWLDAEINSREGVHNESVNGMQNLMYAQYSGYENTSSCREVISGTPTFTNKACKLGGTMFVPSYKQYELTFEFVGNFDSNVFNNIISQQLFTNSVYKGGYQIMVTSDALHYQLFNSSNGQVKNFSYPINIEANKTYHFAITDNFTTTGVTKFYLDGVEVTPTKHNDKTGGVCTSVGTCIGIMGVHSTTARSVYPATTNGEGRFYGEYTNINTLRIWNRALNEEEIKENYNKDKKRFG